MKRLLLPALLAVLPALAAPEATRKDTDVEYGKAGDVVLKLDVTRPEQAPGTLSPAVIFIHGGGFDKRVATLARELVAAGYVYVSIDYRVIREFPFPAAVEDCKRAVRWLREHAKDYGVDPDRIGLFGASSGGLQALMLGCGDPDSKVSSRVQAVCAWFPPTDLEALAHHEEETKNQKEIDFLKGFVGGDLKEHPEAYRKASPVAYATPDDPPVLLVHGEDDPVIPIAQSEAMLEKLKAAHVEADLIRVKHAGHGFKPADKGKPLSPSREALTKATLDFFDKHLKPAR